MNVPTISQPSSIFLDGMRGFSAQLVLIGHAITIFGNATFLQEPISPYLQELGVVVFFVLSGFVITHTTRFKSQTGPEGYRFSYFVIDRFSRIYSVYLPALAFAFLTTFVFNVVKESEPLASIGLGRLVGNLLMLQTHPLFRDGFISEAIGDPFPHFTAYGLGRPFWSIAVEWWLYISFAALFFFLSIWRKGGWGKRLIILPVLGVSLLVPLHQLAGSHRALVLAWVFGAAASFVIAPATQRVRKNAKPALLAGLCIITVSPVPLYVWHTGAYNEVFVAIFSIGLLVSLAALQNLSGGALARASKFFAGYSYSLYAIHYPILILLALTPLDGWPLFAVAIVLCNVTAFVFAETFETQHFRIRKFLKGLLHGSKTSKHRGN